MRPWEEFWEYAEKRTPQETSAIVKAGDVSLPLGAIGFFGTPCPGAEVDSAEEDFGRAQLAAAAPQMARALCRSEIVRLAWDEGRELLELWGCPECHAPADYHDAPGGGWWTLDSHREACGYDQALTTAGLDTDAREEVRRKAAGK